MQTLITIKDFLDMVGIDNYNKYVIINNNLCKFFKSPPQFIHDNENNNITVQFIIDSYNNEYLFDQLNMVFSNNNRRNVYELIDFTAHLFFHRVKELFGINL